MAQAPLRTAKPPDRFRKLEREHYDTIVVGAGIGGLTVAALLATRGHRVLVTDQHYVAGGSATIFKRPGYEFDVGLHYIGECQPNGVISRILRASAARLPEFNELDPDGYDTIVLPDLQFRTPKGTDRFRDRLVETFPAERDGVDRYVKLLEQVQGLDRMFADPKQALGLLPRSGLMLRYINSTLGHFLDSCTSDERLRLVLAGQNGDYGQPPSRASLILHAALVNHYLKGAYYPKGGGQQLSDRLAESIEAHGGKILLRTKVEKIVIEDGRAVGVRLVNKHVGERTVRAQRVISNADLKQTLLGLVGPEHLSRRVVKKTRGYEMSPGLATLYLGVKRDFAAEGMPNTNYWIYPSLDVEDMYRQTRLQRFAPKPVTYVSIASLKDPGNPRLAPAGITNLQLMTLAPSTPEAWGTSTEAVKSGKYQTERYEELKTQLGDRLIAVAEQVLPGLGDSVVFRELSTPLTHARYTLASGGTSYGIALIPSQFLLRRPGAKTEIEGLYLCGASMRTGHGIAGAMMSGVMAAAEVFGMGLLREVLGPANRVAA